MRDHDLMRDVLVRPRASTMRGCRSTSLIRPRAAIVFIDAISFHCGGVGGIAASAIVVPDKGISRVLRGTEQDPCFANELGHLLAKPTWYQPCIEPIFHLIDSHPSEIAWTAAVSNDRGTEQKSRPG